MACINTITSPTLVDRAELYFDIYIYNVPKCYRVVKCYDMFSVNMFLYR